MPKFSRPQTLIAVAAIACFVGTAIVIGLYGGMGYFVELTAGFAAALGAFILALEWEGARERRRLAEGTARLAQQRETETRRRLETVRRELLKNCESLEFLDGELSKAPQADQMRALHPQLLEGAWRASAARLTELLSVYDLTARLAIAYDRIEELRWRLRYRTEQRSTELDGPTHALVKELVPEVTGLIEEVRGQISSPDVQELGLQHRVRVGAAVETAASIDAAVIRGGREPSGS